MTATGGKTAKKPARKRAKPKPPGYVFGRPTLYKPEYCEQVVEMGAQGCSVVQMASRIGVVRTTFETEWPKAHPDFAEALALARQLSQAWWEEQAHGALEKKTFNGALWSRNMASRFPREWREANRTEHSGPDGKPIEIEQTAKGEVVSEIIGLLRDLRRQGQPDA